MNQFSVQIKAATLREDQGLSEDDFKVDFPAMTNILITHCQSKGIITYASAHSIMLLTIQNIYPNIF